MPWIGTRSVTLPIVSNWGVGQTSLLKRIVGGTLHSLALNRFPNSTALSPKITSSLVEGLKPEGMRVAAEPGRRLAFSRVERRDCVWLSRDMTSAVDDPDRRRDEID